MKKIAMLLVAATLTVGLVSCAQDKKDEATTGDNVAVSQMPELTPVSATTYKDGTYRGAFYDGSVVVELELKDNSVQSAKFRSLSYKDEDYLKSEDSTKSALKEQYQALMDHIVGKEITAVVDELYTPGNIAADVDGLSASTIRAGKVISAINDALNRGVYSLPKA